jgi:hypothetical protein
MTDDKPLETQQPGKTISDLDAMRLGFQTYALGLQSQMIRLQDELHEVQHRMSVLHLKEVNSKSIPVMDYVRAELAPAKKQPRGPATGWTEKIQRPKLHLGTNSSGKALYVGKNGSLAYAWAMQHDGILNMKNFMEDHSEEMATATYRQLPKSIVFRKMFRSIPGRKGIYRLKLKEKGAEPKFNPEIDVELPVLKLKKEKPKIKGPVRGRYVGPPTPANLPFDSKRMYQFAVAHGNRLVLADYREQYTHQYKKAHIWHVHKSAMSPQFLRMLREVPGEASVWELKEEFRPKEQQS